VLGEPEGNRPIEGQRSKFMHNIKMDIVERGSGCVDWIDLAQDRDKWGTLVNVEMNFRVP
jgi:hypothetical protein